MTLFNRGVTNPELFPEAEHLVGDRDGALDALSSGSWDAVADMNGYVPRIVRASAELLRDRVGRYLFVSTVSVYASLAEPVSEDSPLGVLEDPETEEVLEHYGELKAACEAVVQDAYGERATRSAPAGRWRYWSPPRRRRWRTRPGPKRPLTRTRAPTPSSCTFTPVAR